MSAIVWVSRVLKEEDALLAAFDALRQEIVVREARRLRLEVMVDRDDAYLDSGLRGYHLVLLSLLRQFQDWGITGLTVDVFTREAWEALAAASLNFEFVDLTEEEDDYDNPTVLHCAHAD